MADPFIQWLQSRLTAHGFACGAIDGVMGPTTEKALKAFQEKFGLGPSGMVDPVTEVSLRASSSIVSPAVAAQIEANDASAPAVKPVETFWPRQSGVPAFFGAVGTRQTTIEVPYDMHLAWDPASRVRRITVHELVADHVGRALLAVAKLYPPREMDALGLNVFGGSLNVRKMRGGSAFSMHSWGIALDFDPQRNGLTTRAPEARLSHPDAEPFWQAWRDVGALSLGQAIGRDWMHVQFARL